MGFVWPFHHENPCFKSQGTTMGTFPIAKLSIPNTLQARENNNVIITVLGPSGPNAKQTWLT